MTKDVRDKLLRVSELEEQRDALKTKINTAEDVDAPDAAAIERLGTELRTAEGNLKTARTEYRERLTLRSKATLGGYLLARMQGRAAGGELAEYQSACGVRGDGIPIDIFESDRPAPVEHRADAATVSPATGTGATLAPIQPYIFSKSIAPMLGIEMPTVGSGAYSEATISLNSADGRGEKQGRRTGINRGGPDAANGHTP